MSLAPRRSAQSRFETLRGLRLHALAYEGQAERPLRVLLHGWMDLAASFQFLVDAFADPAPVLALDWRGFGHSEAGGHDSSLVFYPSAIQGNRFHRLRQCPPD